MRLAASRALRKLALDGVPEIEAMVEGGLLEAVGAALSLPDVRGATAGNLLHALCRLVKDSQEALTAMAQPACPLPTAIAAAVQRATAPAPAHAALLPEAGEPPREGYTRGHSDDDPDGDPLEEAADLLDELWQRLPEAPGDVIARWAAPTLPAALAVAEAGDGGVSLALRAAVNVLSTEAGGERWEDQGARLREPPPGQAPRALAPLHALAVPRMAAVVVRAMQAEDPH